MDIHASNVTDADGVGVVASDMGAGIFLGTPRMNTPILIDNPVVAAAVPSLCLVITVDVGDGDRLVYFGVGAVDNYPLNFLHK